MVAETQTGTNTAQWHSGSKENAQASTESAVRSNKAVGSGTSKNSANSAAVWYGVLAPVQIE